MFKKMKKFLVVLLLISILKPITVEAASFSVSANKSKVEPGGSVNISLNLPSGAEGRFDVKVDNGSTSTTNLWYPDAKGFSVNAGNSGTVTVFVTATNVSTVDLDSITGTKTAKINIEKPKPKPKPEDNNNSSNSNGSDTGSNSGTYNPDLPKGESEAEKKAREEREAAAKLAERKRHPLIKDIVIVSESDRLKGKEVVKLGTEVETFKYSATLPRSIDAFKLDLKAVKDDVKLTYDKMYKLDEGHDKVEIVVKAVQDEVEQTFNITVHRHKESEVSFEDTESNYHLLVDKLIDNELKEFGIERKLFNEKKDDTFYYYEYDDVKFALTYDKDNLARWVLLDDKGELDQEFILLIDAQKKPRFIVDVPLEEDVPTLKGNKYEIVDLELSDDILKLDESMTFNTSVSAWVFDEDGVITHEYVKAPSKDTASTEATVDITDDKPYKLVYVGKDSVVESAFVSFDNVNKNMEYFAYSMLALLVLMIIIFIVYWRSNSKKINNLLNRR